MIGASRAIEVMALKNVKGSVARTIPALHDGKTISYSATLQGKGRKEASIASKARSQGDPRMGLGYTNPHSRQEDAEEANQAR